jgi:uncharacterized protein YbjT (DUF2867 family)
MAGVFITGGTGYVGRSLIPRLLASGLTVRALARPGSEAKVPPGAEIVPGSALDADSYAARLLPSDTLVHLVGVSHPAPWKAEQFRAVDYASVKASVEAARAGSVRRLVYVGVAHPAPVMKAYVAVRQECEELIRSSGLNATILRPWYVLGPGHRWPYLLVPAYWLAERVPQTRASARRLGLVTLDQMTEALLWSIRNPSTGIRILEVAHIRRGGVNT